MLHLLHTVGCRQLGLVAYLSAMTVEHGSLELYQAAIRKLGPDPLREDADKEVRSVGAVGVVGGGWFGRRVGGGARVGAGVVRDRYMHVWWKDV